MFYTLNSRGIDKKTWFLKPLPTVAFAKYQLERYLKNKKKKKMYKPFSLFFFFLFFFFSLIYATSHITNCLFWEFCYFLSYFNIMIIIFEFSSQVFLFAKLYDAKGICFFIIFSYKYIQFSLGIGNYAATKKKGKNVLKQTCQRFIFIFVSFKGKHV